ncbi:MAG: hypothetical protein RRA94_16285 [Bacteroidota bacterium]|nr:hypothetical protein [Bacteroidota bacterium]
MARSTAVRPIFILAGLYDAVLGLAFLLFAPQVFQRFDVIPPNHFGYVRFPAMLLLVFALMFFAVAFDPKRNRNLIPYGILLKVSYCAAVGWYWYHDPTLPMMWKPFAIIDLAFLVAFIWAYRKIGTAR